MAQVPKYKPEFCKMLIEHMAEGLSYKAFCSVAKVNLDTLYDWEKRHPEWLEAKKEALQHCRITWEKIGKAGATGQIKNFSAAAWIFNMKNRFPDEWRETTVVDSTVKTTHEVGGLDELKTLLAKLING